MQNDNKVILINGVDVAGCKNYVHIEEERYKPECNCRLTTVERGYYCDTYATSICEEEDCEYKQLKRLEQENKELKDKITTLEDKLQLRMASDKESDEFWDEIFSAEDYPFNKENAYKELKDYYFVLEQIPKIYMEITGGTLSKTTYFASSVIQAYNDALERYYDKIDDLEYNNNTYRSALEEILESAKFAQCLPCGSGNLEDCLNCDDETTNNGQFCMEKRIHEIKTKCVEVLK